MVSVIVCSKDPQMVLRLGGNIAATIGVPYEFLVIDNSKRKYNIFQAYNIGVERSKYDILCFTHEDIIFHTKDWGKLVLKHFENKDLGMIGICGGTAMPRCPAPWWNNPLLNVHMANNINTWTIDKPSGHDFRNPFNETSSDAVLVDGAWFCMPKSLFNNCRFDEINFDHFHCYDSDMCLQVLHQKKKVMVVFDILLEHFSDGEGDPTWADAVDVLCEKWHDQLPIFSKKIDLTKLSLYHYRELLSYAYFMQSRLFPDEVIRKRIRKYWKIIPHKFIYREALLLYLWMNFGYHLNRYIYFFLKYFFSNKP